MGIEISNPGGGGITVETDPLALLRTGGIMSGAIRFDEVGIQNISKGSFDSGRGGYNGVSLNCAVGYELNWQAGYLKAINEYGTVQPINIESNLIIDTGAGSAGHYETTEMYVTRTDANIGAGQSNAYGALYNGGVEVGDIDGKWAELTTAHLRFGDGTIQTTAAQIPVFKNQIVTNSRLENTKTFPHQIALAETDAGTVYSSSKQFRDFEQYDGDDYGVKNYTLDGFGLENFHIKGCPNVRTIALTNMPNLSNVKIGGTGTIENINLDGSTKVTYLNLNNLTFSTTNFLDMVSNFVMRGQENTLFLTYLNLAGAIPSTWYNNWTVTLGIDNVAVDDLSFINATTFPYLRWLRIGYNVPASLPDTNYASFTHLESLYARGRGVYTFSLPSSIVAVDLSESAIYDFEASMSGSFPNLISINFANCGLDYSDITFIPINAGIKYLNLQGNDFSDDYLAGEANITNILDAVDALNEDGSYNNISKVFNFTGTNMPVFTSTPTSVINLRNRGYNIYGNGL